MSINNAYKQYKETQVNTANQGKLIVMLYDGAIKFLNKALEHMSKKEIEETHKNIVKIKDIITELITSLNMDAGEISQRLFSIYMYINNKLSEANIKKAPGPLNEVKKYLIELRDAWVEACKNTPTANEEDTKGGINIAT